MTTGDSNSTTSKKSNYIVTVQGFSGKKAIHCETEAEVWEALNSGSFGALTSVGSHTGRSVEKFVPY